MNVIFDHSQSETPTISTFYFKTAKPLAYTAGQFTELTIPHDDPDDRGIRRWFTLSSAPGKDYVTITTRLSNEKSTFKRALQNLQPGTELAMADPMGDFVLPKDSTIPLVFIAGGIGITPFHSMLEWLAETNQTRKITFLYAVTSEDDIIFQDTFQRANQHVTIIVSQPSDAWGGERGRLTAEKILHLAHPSDRALLYSSGPEPMLEALTSDLQKTGLSKAQLVTDFFPGYTTF